MLPAAGPCEQAIRLMEWQSPSRSLWLWLCAAGRKHVPGARCGAVPPQVAQAAEFCFVLYWHACTAGSSLGDLTSSDEGSRPVSPHDAGGAAGATQVGVGMWAVQCGAACIPYPQ